MHGVSQRMIHLITTMYYVLCTVHVQLRHSLFGPRTMTHKGSSMRI
jgi:hypothetical protein